MEDINAKIRKLRSLTDKFIFIEYYSHLNCDVYKIENQYTKFAEEKIVLCRLQDGIETAIDKAVDVIQKAYLNWIEEPAY